MRKPLSKDEFTIIRSLLASGTPHPQITKMMTRSRVTIKRINKFETFEEYRNYITAAKHDTVPELAVPSEIMQQLLGAARELIELLHEE